MAMGFIQPILIASAALAVLASTMGQCNPAQAIKIMEAELSRGKNLQQAFELVIKNKAFDGSKACITFIREEAMKSRESTPLIFKKLWLD